MEIKQIIRAFYSMPEASEEMFSRHTREVSYPKGHILLSAGKIERRMYFVKKGIVRAYAPLDEAEITFWFGEEGAPVVSMESYVAGKPGYEYIELLEDCQLYELYVDDLHNLFTNDINIANWGRKFAESELIRAERRLISRQFRSAAERYKELLIDKPTLLQRVPLGHIASYLGITQVTLSRIRADISR